MPKVICVKCKLFFRPKRNGVVWEEGMQCANSEGWAPYKLWHADLWECRSCGAQIITGHGDCPISEHYMPDYERMKTSYPDVLRVNDC